MIVKIIDSNSISVKPEEPDDMVALRRAISIGDRIAGSTTREIKREKENIRPDKGQRTRIKILLESKKITLDGSLDRLKVVGIIIESNNESVSHGSHHSMQIKIDDAITITKRTGWKDVEKNLLVMHSSSYGFVLVAVDTSECGIARIKGTRLDILPNIYSGASGKRYKNAKVNMDKFYNDVIGTIESVLKKGDQIIVFGPGMTKNRVVNYMQKAKLSCKIAEGIDAGGEDGIYVFTKSEAMRVIMSESKIALASKTVEQIMHLAGKKSSKFAMGINDVSNACDLGAIETIIFSDGLIRGDGEVYAIKLLNDAESKGAKAIAVDSTTDIGLRVESLGGIVALLRYSINY
ncbi:MAG: eRF1 domain-containing protein [Cenarchaeum symbiont of Oopsacas minuta]|nr:eRF1 domain-containing protein [Cenarchaeum symbiont of Oopsacas minuta]